MGKYLVTGGTGLIGSNVCRRLVEHGGDVSALVRPGSDSGPLTAIGVEAFPGDVRSADDLVRASEGCEAIVNAAALLGGAVQDVEAHRLTNTGGSSHAYDAGAEHGIRVVALSSTPFFDHRTTLTEDARVAEQWSEYPYTQTKAAAYVEAKRRVEEEGGDIVIVVPGGTFGPGLSLERALGRTSYNRTVRAALNGRIRDYLTYMVPWVSADDVAAACVAAATVGTTGRTYLAFGAEDAQSTASWLNLACEVAGVRHRIAERIADPSDVEVVERFGETQVHLAQRRFPVPWFDNALTRHELRYEPRPLAEVMEETVRWLRDNDQVS